jgi:hypothetical protein
MRFLSCFAIAALSALANDTLATLGAGGLIPAKSTGIAMEREELEISFHQITVNYVFRNLSDKDIDATVAFPLPALEGSHVEMEPMQLPSRDKLNFVDFEVFVAGKPVKPSTEVRAFDYHGHDITERLRAVGLPVSVIDPHFLDAARKLTAQQRAPFVKEDLLLSDNGGREWWPGWTSKVQFYWTQRFPAKSTLEVQHKYRPVVGGAYITVTDAGESTIKPYCGGPETLSQIQAVKKKHPVKPDQPAIYEKRIQYILTTANNWSGPIRNFRLTVIADSPDDIVLTCMPGLKRIAPTRYQLSRADFRPASELDLLILHAQ